MESNKVGNTLNTPLEILLGTCEEKKIHTPLKNNLQIPINLFTHLAPCPKRMKNIGPILFTLAYGVIARADIVRIFHYR
jgi:hypothetical protein